MDRTKLSQFNWLNEGTHSFEEEKMVIIAPPKSDFAYDNGMTSESGELPKSLNNAPYFYTEVEGDFVMSVNVSLTFKDTFDASAIMIHHNEECWAKACLERTDFNKNAVVSVVRNKTTDDANGNHIEGNTVWLKVVRVGNSFSFHYSLNGEHYEMMRVFHLPVKETIKVGFVAQAPVGDGGERYFSDYKLENKTVKNIRDGQ
ncbi:DUF1349 domain-containing protein [Alkalicoccobacillus gibsonii]|uniref:DUF1349 domain-containing protein n=1 Tax=Alkalicoccobacillus gibsonii TaxID=79881 RepID=A0ABU9VEM4_9BACI